MRSLKHKRAIGVLAAAGDRRDEDIRELGRIAATGFDHLVLREDGWLRGRQPGETAELLAQGVRSAGTGTKIEIVLDELVAVDHGLGIAQPGDLVVVFADDITGTWKKVIYWNREDPRSDSAP